MIADSRVHGNFSFVHVHDISNCELARNRRDIITVGTVISLSFRVLLVLPPHHAVQATEDAQAQAQVMMIPRSE